MVRLTLVHLFVAVAIVTSGDWPAGVAAAADTGLAAERLRCEYLVDPLGIDVRQPRLTWMLTSQQRCQRQTAFQVLVASSRELLDRESGDLWDSGKVASDQSVHVVYAGKPLDSRAQCHWKVRVWDKDGRPSAWSQAARWTMGLLEPDDWQGRWIGPPEATGPQTPSPWLRKCIRLATRPTAAWAYVASIGYHELYVNGQKAGDAVLGPSVTNYARRVRYVTYDITSLLREGDNCVGIWLGNGWATHKFYALEGGARVLGQFEIGLSGGTRQTLVTDGSWKSHPSPIRGIGRWQWGDFGGEQYDAALEQHGWCRVPCNDSAWTPVKVFGPQTQILSADMVEPNRLMEVISPSQIATRADGTVRIDMGRAYTGWLEVALHGRPGQRITLEYSERPEQACSFNQRDVYVCGPSAKGVFRSRFNYHAFRWVTLGGLDRAPAASEVKGYLIRTAFRPAATFACSDQDLNRIDRFLRWTYECLALGACPVDCPHRERLGYGAEGLSTMPTGLSHFDLGAFYTKWLVDWRDCQQPSGELPHTAPQYVGGGGPGWGGICAVLPWEMFVRYGDRRSLEQCYPMIERWLAFLESKSRDDLLQPFTVFTDPRNPDWSFLGDWVPPRRGMDAKQRVDLRSTHFFNNCFWMLDLRLAAKIAGQLGRPSEAAAYNARANAVAKAAHRQFFVENQAAYANGEQTYLAFPLWVDLPPAGLRTSVMDQLERTIRHTDGGHLNTGVLGTWVLYQLLMGRERHDLLHEITRQPSFPGWRHMLAQGATACWEDWSANPAPVYSRLHASYLGGGNWFLEGVAGIRPDQHSPGYKHFFLSPAPVGDLKHAAASYDSMHGPINTRWSIDDATFALEVSVPPGTSATLRLPTRQPEAVQEGGQPVAQAQGVRRVGVEPGIAIYTLDSGRYRFTAPAPGRR